MGKCGFGEIWIREEKYVGYDAIQKKIYYTYFISGIRTYRFLYSPDNLCLEEDQIGPATKIIKY